MQQRFLDNEKEVLKKLKSNYQDALGEINSKLEILMARQDADMQHVIYQVEYQKALKKQVQSILEQLQNDEFESISEYLTSCYEDGFIGTMYDLQGQGIPLVFPIDQEQVVTAIQHETKLSTDLYTALGKDVNVLQKKIAGEISRGISSGQMFNEIARNISAYAGISRNNAMRIARTEGHRIQCKATADAQFKAKDKGADVVKQWDSTLDSKTRDTHKQLDGQIKELEEPFEVAGKRAMQPGGFGYPEEDINCRCALLQRARWALGGEYTKWSPDAPVLISDDGTTQFTILQEKNYEAFKGKFKTIEEQMKLIDDFCKEYEINDEEKKSLYDYIGFQSYIVNEQLRNGNSLTKSEKEFINTLNLALDKAPKYNGNLQRSLYFDDKSQMKSFIDRHDIGNDITYDEFISTTKGEMYNPEGQVQIYIQNAKNGSDISVFNEKEQEILYKAGSQFKVINRAEQSGTYFILLEEI